MIDDSTTMICEYYTIIPENDESGAVSKFNVVQLYSEPIKCRNIILSSDSVFSESNGKYGFSIDDVDNIIQDYIYFWEHDISVKADPEVDELFEYCQQVSEILEDIKALSKMRNNVFKNSNFYNCKLKNQVVLLRDFNENNDNID